MRTRFLGVSDPSLLRVFFIRSVDTWNLLSMEPSPAKRARLDQPERDQASATQHSAPAVPVPQSSSHVQHTSPQAAVYCSPAVGLSTHNVVEGPTLQLTDYSPVVILTDRCRNATGDIVSQSRPSVSLSLVSFSSMSPTTSTVSVCTPSTMSSQTLTCVRQKVRESPRSSASIMINTIAARDQPATTQLSASTGNLSINDLQAVYRDLFDARERWQNFGIELKMKDSDLKAIGRNYRDNPDDCFRELLTTWLNQGNPKTTWATLVSALKSPTVGYERLSKKVQQKYLSNANASLGTLECTDNLQPTADGLTYDSEVIPSLTTAMSKLNEHLLNHHYNQFESYKFPHLPKKKFITLALVKKEGINRANADTFTKGTLHGHTDEILKKKMPIELEAIFEPLEDQKHVKRIFLEGAPGIGKSTVALELCRTQKEIKSMKEYSLVLLLPLRDKAIQNIKSIQDLFKVCHHDSKLQQSVTEEVVACGGKNLLFILDGFDELPISLRKDSFFVDLIQGRQLLPECTVVVTSRPSASADLLKCIKSYKHIEVIGFTQDRIEQYVRSMLYEQPQLLEEFKKYISINPAIRGLMYIPLNSALVVRIYEDNKSSTGRPIPRTMTQLYTELSLTLLRKNLEEKEHPLADQVNCSSTLEDLPKNIKDQLLMLGKVSFQGVLDNELTFNVLPDGCDDLGFMKVSTGLYLGAKLYSFLHLTLQEFLAAYYFSQLPPVEQKLKFIENSGILDHSEKIQNSDIMWRFVAGLTGFTNVGWSVVHQADKSTSKSDICSPFIIQCLFEVQNEEEIKAACDEIVDKEDTTISVTAKTHLDCFATGYCIAVSGQDWNINIISDGNEAVEMLANGLQSARCIRGSIFVLDLQYSNLTKKAIGYLNELPNNILEKISNLQLWNNCLDTIAVDYLADVVPHMSSLSFLDLSDNPVDIDGMVKIFQNLSHSRTLQNLNIGEINLGLSDIQALSQLMKSCNSLKHIEVGHPQMPANCVSLMLEVLLSPSSLNHLTFFGIDWTPNNTCNFALLENNKNLATLYLSSELYAVDMNPAVVAIAKAMHKNDTLKYLRLPHHEFPELELEDQIEHESVVALSEMLKVNTTLKILEIHSYLNYEDITVLGYALKGNKTLENLTTYNNHTKLNVKYSDCKEEVEVSDDE